MKNVILIVLVFMGCFSELLAQFSVSSQLHSRSEFRDGYRSPKGADSDAAFFISQRTRLNIAFKNEKVKLFISPQDVRVWGAEKQLAKDPSFGLHEAWGQYLHISRPGSMLDSNLGGEVDAVYGYKIAPYTTFNLGLSMYFPNATTEQIKGGDKGESNTWAWIMLTLKPELFSTKKKE